MDHSARATCGRVSTCARAVATCPGASAQIPISGTDSLTAPNPVRRASAVAWLGRSVNVTSSTWPEAGTLPIDVNSFATLAPPWATAL